MRSSLILTGTILLMLACSQGETPPAANTTSAAPSAETPTFRRNHYKGWKLDTPVPFAASVTLTEPRSGLTRPVDLETIAYLFNPATKHHHGDHGNQNDPLHYVAYTIRTVPSPGSFTFRNQFGTATWNFTDNEPSWLLVPARRNHPSGTPWGGDHLLCYAVTGPLYPAANLTVTDLLTGNPPPPITELTPSHFCVPVSKQREGHPTENITNHGAYLTIYKYVVDESSTRRVSLNDQFHTPQPLILQHLKSERLAVPAWD